MTSAIWMVMRWESSLQCGVRHGAWPTAQSTSSTRPQLMQIGVVVVVAHPRLIQRRGMRRLEAAQHLQVRQVTQDHVHGLRGQFRQFLAGGREDAFRRGMRVVFDGGQHCQPLLGHPAAVGTQGRGPCFVAVRVVRHAPIQALIMTRSQ